MVNKNRKKSIYLLLLTIGILVCATICIVADKQLFYYGANKFPHGKILGYADVENLHKKSPVFPNGIRLQDDGLPIIAKESVFRGYKGITVDTIISYGFNDSIIVAQFTSTKGIEYYYVDTPFAYHPVIIPLDEVTEKNPIKVFHLKRWFSGVNCPPQSLLIVRNVSLMVSIAMIIVLLWLIGTPRRKAYEGAEG